MGVVLLVRHGQASFGADDYDVLSEIGWAQGRQLGKWLGERGVTPSAVVHGDMHRQRDTALAMAEGAGWAGVEPGVDPGWDEFDHVGMVAAYPDLPPDVDLTDRRAFQRLFEEATAHWTSGEPGDFAETYADFVARVRAALDRATGGAGPGATVVVVSSGGPIAVACAALLAPGADPLGVGRLWHRLNTVIVNSSVSRVVVGSTGARLLTFN
ncbi:MAG TPA: histidine phosphatase family protein, partial [Nocardioides sp.]|nr:histidine phosphatase family protein [Nocardioides sp.]